MKKYLTMLLLVCSSYLSAASWNSAGQIPLGTSLGARSDVSVAYYPKLKKVVAAWADISLQALPYYSIFDGTSWTMAQPLLLSNTIGVANNLNLQSFPKLQLIAAAWGEPGTGQSYYSLFNGTNWTTPAKIDPANTFTVGSEINMTYDKLNNRVIAAWGDANNTIHPVFAVLPTSLVWSAVGFISSAPSSQVFVNVNLAYNRVNNEVVAVWANNANFPFPPIPVFSSFNAAAFPTSSITWNPVAPIPLGGSSGVSNDVRIGSSPTTVDMLAAWADASNPVLYGAPFDGTTFFGTGIITQPPLCGGALADVTVGVIKTSNMALLTWGCAGSGSPAFFLQPPGTPGVIPQSPSAGVLKDVNSTFNENLVQTVAVWVDQTSNQPFFNTYQ